MDTTTLTGVIGAAVLLVAFGANKFGKLKTSSFSYDLLNVIGAGLLTWYAVLLNSVPFFVLEGIWTLVALRSILQRFLARKP